MIAVKLHRYSATVNGERRSCVIAYPLDWGDLNEDEAELMMQNDQALYVEFYGSNPSDDDLEADLEDVKLEEVTE